LSNPSNSNGGATLDSPPNIAVLTIFNDDVAFRFSSASYSVSESAGSANITVERLGETENGVSVNFATSDGTAIGDFQPDYTPTNGSLTFNPGETTKTFVVSIVNDPVVEDNETVNLSLSNATNPNGTATLDSPSTAVLTILNEDVAFRFSSSSYTVSESGVATIEVQRLGDTTGTAAVNFATSDGTPSPTTAPATAGSDYVAATGVLSFGPGETTKTFGVGIIPDTIPERPVNPVGHAALATPDTAVLTILNDDVVFHFSRGAYVVHENDGTATIEVSRIGDTANDVSVDYATVGGGTATAGSDYLATSGRLTFSPGRTTQSFDVTILDDLGPESHETVNLLLRDPVNPVGHAALATPDTAVLTILNDDVVFHFSRGA
ncbi:MAG: aggregation factor core protein MAFp3, isoform C, partial [Deltaproteobacteria bacterium]|nr:aggregation factor core protein MAFp3, isoform C [Deltaproteobacteria bacterium]